VPVLDLLNWLRFYGERSKDGDWLGYLWTPLNGHREVFTRMLLALDVKWFGAQGETFAASGFVLLLGMAVAICWRILKSDLSISWKLTAILIAVLLLTPVNTVIMIGMQQNGCLLQISSFGVFARVALNCVANGKVHFRTSGFNRRRAISRYFHSLQKPGRRAAGIAGGSAVGDLLKGFDLGPLRNAVAGAVGGVVGAKILELLIPALRGLTHIVGQISLGLRPLPNK